MFVKQRYIKENQLNFKTIGYEYLSPGNKCNRHGSSKAGFPLGGFVRENREKSNLIGWRQTLTSSPPNHIRFLLVRANKFAEWKTGLRKDGICCCCQLANHTSVEKSDSKFCIGSFTNVQSSSLPTFLSYFAPFFNSSSWSLFSTPREKDLDKTTNMK